MFLKKRNEPRSLIGQETPAAAGYFGAFFCHKIAIEQKQTAKRRRFGCEKEKQKKSLHPPGGELLSAMQVPSDLALASRL